MVSWNLWWDHYDKGGIYKMKGSSPPANVAEVNSPSNTPATGAHGSYQTGVKIIIEDLM